MKRLILITVLVAIASAATATGILMAQTPSEDDWMRGLPHQHEDGTWDPEWFPVGNDTGAIVGVAKTADMFGDSDVYPMPVYDEDNPSVQIGWVGKSGYYTIGESEPWCQGCKSVIEEIGSDGYKKVTTETYNNNRTITRVTEETDREGNITTTTETIGDSGG